jgi:serine/threonine protein kinase
LFDVAKGLKYLHSLDIPHGNLKGVSRLADPFGGIPTAALAALGSLSFQLRDRAVLIPWRQANVVIDREGRARLTEYGLAPINFEPSFAAVAEIPGACGTSRWLAPEFMGDTHNGTDTPAMESCPADVFAFAMVAVEVFTGKIPFEKQKTQTAAQKIAKGDRPEMPGNAQEVGLTGEMWKLLESCWHQDPKKRPKMEEVVKEWEKFVGRNSIARCVQLTPAIKSSSSVPSSPFYDRPRTKQPAAGPSLSNRADSGVKPTDPGAVRPPTQPPVSCESSFPGWCWPQALISTYRCQSI